MRAKTRLKHAISSAEPAAHLLGLTPTAAISQPANYKKLFTDEKLKRLINPWIGNKKIFIIIANLIKYILNSNSKEEFYKYVKYFNHYSNHYHSYNFSYFLKRASYIRNHTSLNVETFICENVPDQKNFNIS